MACAPSSWTPPARSLPAHDIFLRAPLPCAKHSLRLVQRGFPPPEKGAQARELWSVAVPPAGGPPQELWAVAPCHEAQEDESHVLKRGNEGQPPGPADMPEGPCLRGPAQGQLWVREGHGPAPVLVFLRLCPGWSSACGLRKLRSPLPFALMPTMGARPAEVPSLRWPGRVFRSRSSPPGLNCCSGSRKDPCTAPTSSFARLPPTTAPSLGKLAPSWYLLGVSRPPSWVEPPLAQMPQMGQP